MTDPRINSKERDKEKIQVLRVKGLKNDQIAEALECSPRTVYNYLKEIREESAAEVSRVDLFGLLGEAQAEWDEAHRSLLLSYYMLDQYVKDGKLTFSEAIRYKLKYSQEIRRSRHDHVSLYVKCGVVQPRSAEVNDDVKLVQVLRSLTPAEHQLANDSPADFDELLARKQRELGLPTGTTAPEGTADTQQSEDLPTDLKQSA